MKRIPKVWTKTFGIRFMMTRFLHQSLYSRDHLFVAVKGEKCHHSAKNNAVVRIWSFKLYPDIKQAYSL